MHTYNFSVDFRPATMDDAQLLYDWRNHPSTRAMMFDSEPFTFEQHMEWLGRALGDTKVFLWVAELDGEPVGTVRLDRVAHAVVEVSITTAPDKRGLGYGTRVLQHLLSGIGQNVLMQYVKAVVALIKPDNAASLKAFANAGFVEHSRNDKEVLMVVERQA